MVHAKKQLMVGKNGNLKKRKKIYSWKKREIHGKRSESIKTTRDSTKKAPVMEKKEVLHYNLLNAANFYANVLFPFL